MGQRILKNLVRVQGYLATLEKELEQTGPTVPGMQPERWQRLSQDLKASLERLQQALLAVDWQETV
jgi:hypothetical protein